MQIVTDKIQALNEIKRDLINLDHDVQLELLSYVHTERRSQRKC